MLEHVIKFEPSAPYSQKQNRFVEKKRQIPMEQVRSIILEEVIPDNFWPKILFAMTYVSNLLSTSFLDKLSLYEVLIKFLPKLNHFWELGSIVYVFIYKEKIKAKFAKWNPWTKRRLLVGYNGHSIY